MVHGDLGILKTNLEIDTTLTYSTLKHYLIADLIVLRHSIAIGL